MTNLFPEWLAKRGFGKIDLRLHCMQAGLEVLGRPQGLMSNIIHIAGTNGKGSTLSIIQHLLQKSNFSCNKYTSPHLVELEERIFLKDKYITMDMLNQLFTEMSEVLKSNNHEDNFSFFEVLTVLAFQAFSQNNADFNLIETGLGGLYDATNVIDQNLCAVITKISYDHMEFLGNELTEIATNKAGIIKPLSNVVLARQDNKVIDQVIIEHAKKQNSKLFIVDDLVQIDYQNRILLCTINSEVIKIDASNFSLIGEHQLDNLATALTVFFYVITPALSQKNHLISNAKDIEKSLSTIYWQGRLEEVRSGKLVKTLPNKDISVILDGGHNEDAALAIVKWLNKKNLHNDYEVTLISNMKNTKTAYSFYEKFIGKITTTYIYSPDIAENNYQMFEAEQLQEELIKMGFQVIKNIHSFENIFQDVAQKISNTKANKHIILICGSLIMVGDFIARNKE